MLAFRDRANGAGKPVCLDLSKLAQWIFVPYMNAQHTAFTTENTLNNQRDKMASSIEITKALSQTPLRLPCELQSKVAVVAEMEAFPWLNTEPPHPVCGYHHRSVPNLPISETNAKSHHHTWWQVDYIAPFPSHSESNFFSLESLSLPAVNMPESKSFNFRMPYSLSRYPIQHYF